MTIPERAVVAGVDSGGTKTECWIADREGRVLGRGIAPGANALAAGRDALRAALGESLRAALADADRDLADVQAACLALAGYWPGRRLSGWRKDAPPGSEQSIVPEDFADLFPAGIPLRLEPDVSAALQSAAGSGPAIALIAGTGSVAFGRNAQGETARAGGWGHLLGDEGSGYWIGLRALHAALRSHDGRERETLLARTVPAALGVAAPPDLVAPAYQAGGMGKREVAALSPLVTEAAEQGDAVALGILDAAAAELALMVSAVARRLGLTGEAFPVVAAGGVFAIGERILEPLCRALAASVPGARVARAETRPAWGAVLFAMLEAGWPLPANPQAP